MLSLTVKEIDPLLFTIRCTLRCIDKITVVCTQTGDMDESEAPSGSKGMANPYLAENVRKRKLQSLPVPPDVPGPDHETTNAVEDNENLKECPIPTKENQPCRSVERKENHVPAVGPSHPNTGLAYWQRLPSKNLTFGSAEILTVEECIKYRVLYRGRPVRVTGHLHHRSFTENNDDATKRLQVLLELIHIETTILSPSTASSSSSSGLAKSKTPIKVGTYSAITPAKSSIPTASHTMSSQKSPMKTPTLGLRRPLLKSGDGGGGGGTGLLLSSKRKRPWFSTTKSNRKDPPNKPATPTGPMLLKVLVDPELPNLSDITPSGGTTKVMVIGTMLDDGSIQARFVVLTDVRLDMNLYVTALIRRRRFLYQRHHHRLQQQQQEPQEAMPEHPSPTKDCTQQDDQLIQGCGPPPYVKFLESEKDRI